MLYKYMDRVQLQQWDLIGKYTSDSDPRNIWRVITACGESADYTKSHVELKDQNGIWFPTYQDHLYAQWQYSPVLDWIRHIGPLTAG